MASPTAAPLTHEDLRAAAAASTELGDGYDQAVADSLLQRLDAAAQQRTARAPTLAEDVVSIVIALGSIGLGVLLALVARHLGELGGTLATIVAWAGIAVINVAHARARRA